MRWAFLLVLVTGCRSLLGIEEPTGDLGDAAVCPDPPAGCTTFTCPTTNACYYACGEAGGLAHSWQESANACGTSARGCLATIDSAAKDTCIRNAVHSDYAWIGYRQAATGIEPAGGWGWQCGSSPFIGWAFTQPDDVGESSDCARTTFAGWADEPCATASRYVCELPR